MQGSYNVAVKDTNLKANHNSGPTYCETPLAVKDTNLKANHNTCKQSFYPVLAVKDTNLKANHNKKLKSIHTPVPEDFLIIITHVRDEAYRYLKRGMFFMLPL